MSRQHLGRAPSAIQSRVTDWTILQRKVEENLTSINAALANASRVYEEVEHQNARLFNS